MEEQDFDRFWGAYPKKRSKGEAFKAWGATKSKRPPIDRILKALAVLKASEDWRKEGGQYIPYPSTWLRAWGWEDVPEVQISDVRADGKPWWTTVSGVEEKALELGVAEWSGHYAGRQESFQEYTKRVRAIAERGNVIPMVRSA